MEEIQIKPPYIKLGQLLKFLDIVSTGGDEKQFLMTNEVLINGIVENRRGRKVYPSDEVKISNSVYKIIERC